MLQYFNHLNNTSAVEYTVCAFMRGVYQMFPQG